MHETTFLVLAHLGSPGKGPLNVHVRRTRTFNGPFSTLCALVSHVHVYPKVTNV